MGWFTADNANKKDISKESLELPRLPELPELPKMNIEEEAEENELHQLPSLPSNQFGEKFSQNVIKEAVIGRKEEDEERNSLGELIPKVPQTREIEERDIKENRRESFEKEIPEDFKEPARRLKKAEPVFVRIDKFQESLDIFDRTKKKISEIEQLLKDTKKIKEEEEKELEEWEKQIQEIKEQIHNIDKEIFSRIE